MRYVTLPLLLLVLACTDKAEKDFRECEALEAKGDISGAVVSCETASRMDPASKMGVAATTKRKELEPAYQKWKADQEIARQKAEEEQRKAAIAAAEARQRAVAALKRKVSVKYWGFEPDGSCTAEGKPPFRKNYEGGTYEENETVALGEGCQHLFPPRGSRSPNDNTFCCPK